MLWLYPSEPNGQGSWWLPIMLYSQVGLSLLPGTQKCLEIVSFFLSTIKILFHYNLIFDSFGSSVILIHYFSLNIASGVSDLLNCLHCLLSIAIYSRCGSHFDLLTILYQGLGLDTFGISSTKTSKVLETTKWILEKLVGSKEVVSEKIFKKWVLKESSHFLFGEKVPAVHKTESLETHSRIVILFPLTLIAQNLICFWDLLELLLSRLLITLALVLITLLDGTEGPTFCKPFWFPPNLHFWKLQVPYSNLWTFL